MIIQMIYDKVSGYHVVEVIRLKSGSAYRKPVCGSGIIYADYYDEYKNEVDDNRKISELVAIRSGITSRDDIDLDSASDMQWLSTISKNICPICSSHISCVLDIKKTHS